MIAGATDDDELALARRSRWQVLAMGRIEMLLVAALERRMTGNENAALEDADFIGKGMNVNDAAACRSGTRLSSLRTVR